MKNKDNNMTEDKSMHIDQLIALKVKRLTAIRERNFTISTLRQQNKLLNNADFREATRLDNEIKKLTKK